MYGIGGDLQAAFYLRGIAAVGNPNAKVAGFSLQPDFRFVVQETYPPYAVSVIEIGADVIGLADAKVDRAIAIWKACLSTNHWPAYPPEAYRAELPAWVEARFLEEEIAA